MRQKYDFRDGDIVRHTGRFLRNTGQYTGAPVNGMVHEPHAHLGGKLLLDVEWSDGNRCNILACNVEHDPRHPRPCDCACMTGRYLRDHETGCPYGGERGVES